MSRFAKNLLIIQAHPDDAEAWSAGTLSLLKDKGWTITIASLTAGNMGGVGMSEEETVATRVEEAKAAAAALGANFHCFMRRDAYLFDSEELRIEVVSLIRKVKAGVVITHAPFDYHQDHRTTCQVVDAAAIVSSLPNVPSPEPPLDITPLLYHGMPMSLSDPLGNPVPEPHFFVDISGKPMEKKMEMLTHHKTQQDLMRLMHKMDDFFGEMRIFNAELGAMVGCAEAECYWQHLGGGYQKDPLLQEELAPYIRHREENQK
ncbi:MAG: PIG-L family deacetylase [Spirochaetales bacterium]|nr:PIG-L family deacetylase [Spirochaetales bacterium]